MGLEGEQGVEEAPGVDVEEAAIVDPEMGVESEDEL